MTTATFLLGLAVLALALICLRQTVQNQQLKWELEVKKLAPTPSTICMGLMKPGTYRRVKDPRVGIFIPINSGDIEPDSRHMIPAWSYNPADLMWEKFIVGLDGTIRPIETLARRRSRR